MDITSLNVKGGSLPTPAKRGGGLFTRGQFTGGGGYLPLLLGVLLC